MLDREGMILRPDGVAVFDRLHSHRHDGEVQLLGFDLLELDRANLRQERLEWRKVLLAKLLRRSHDGIQVVEHVEALRGRVRARLQAQSRRNRPKRRDQPYQHGRSRAWLKIKNPESPAMQRVWEDRL